jgi:RNA polymerase sigma-70 factor (ECF subfamily)
MTFPLPSEETQQLLALAREGSGEAVNDLLKRHRPYLRYLVGLRIDSRIAHRLDPSDVVQEVLLEVARELPRYLQTQPLPFHLWLRQTACDRLAMASRRHLGAQSRDAGRDVLLSDQSSIVLARGLAASSGSPPINALVKQELIDRVRQAIASLDPGDAEMILLRNLESLTNLEAAQVLAITPAAASKRYARALIRLQKTLRDVQGEEDTP